MNTKVLHIGLLAATVGLLVGVAVYRANQERVQKKPDSARVSSPSPSSKPLEKLKTEPPALPPAPVDTKKQGAALHESTLASLIENARMAQQRGDSVTRDAMLSGMKKSPEKSKELISKQLQTTRDQAAVAALQTLLERLQ